MEKIISIQSKMGIHARPAGIIVNEAKKYHSEIIIVRNHKEYNCKSIMSIMSAGIKKGDEILVRVNGDDEKEALRAMIHLLESSLDV